MKRQMILVFAVITTANSFAYYGDYSSSPSFELPGWLTFTGYLMIIWGILEIILFFKIWDMTNDIRAMKKDHIRKSLVEEFMYDVQESYCKMPVQGYEKDENGKEHIVSYKEQNLHKPIALYVEHLRKELKNIGEPLPPYISRMATYSDFFNLFTKVNLMKK